MCLFLASMASAKKDRIWIPAKVVSISSTMSDNGVAVVPVGPNIYGVRIKTTTIYYRIETADMIYVLALISNNATDWHREHPLNLTLHGETKISIDRDGKNAHVLDDGGKDVKVPIAEKIAKEAK